MPTEIFVGKFGSKAEDKTGEVYPGDPPASLTDLSEAGKTILSVVCRNDDSGTDVYRFTWEPYYEDNLIRAIDAGWYTPENIIHSIEVGEEWTHRMVTAKRRIVKLIVRHSVLEQ